MNSGIFTKILHGSILPQFISTKLLFLFLLSRTNNAHPCIQYGKVGKHIYKKLTSVSTFLKFSGSASETRSLEDNFPTSLDEIPTVML